MLSLVNGDRLAIRSGHGVGKSTLLAWAILWFMATRFPAKIPCTANTAAQLYDVLWAELAKWHRRMLPELAEMFEWKGERFELRASPNESFAVARTARKEQPEAFQGFHSENLLLIADEASGVDNAIFEAGGGAMSTKGAKTILASNPTRNDGFFFEAFNGKARHLWTPFHVPCSASQYADPKYAADIELQYGKDSDYYRVRVMGNFPIASEMQFIPITIVDEAMVREPMPFMTDPLILGVDVARFGDDQSVICPRKGRDARTLPWKRFRNVDTMTLASAVAELYSSWRADAVFVDGGGVGGGVVDRLRQLSVPVVEVQFGGKADRIAVGTGAESAAYANKRAEMWGGMRDWLKGGAIPDDAQLKADMIGTQYGFDNKNQIILERKEDMKKRGLASPDLADALAITFAYSAQPHQHAGYLGAGGSVPTVRSEYDPFNA